MFPQLARRDAGAGAIKALAAALPTAEGLGSNDRIPAGHTYLGQFIDHDISFDPTSKLQRDNDPDALVDFRTPRLDLDSVYGSGPADQPYLYDWHDAEHPGVKLLIGAGPADCAEAAVDLPRNRQGRAVIGDARNDENLIIAQLHLLFLRFHNQVVEHLRATAGRWDAVELFEEAQRLVRWHYQWIVRHEYLPRVVGDPLEGFKRRFFTWRKAPFIPVEFSGAAFRFGHSMVRGTYSLNDTAGVVPIFPPPGATGAASSHHLRGFRPLPAALVIQWPRFFVPVGGAPARMSSMRIDAHLSEALFRLPSDDASLAGLNLQRGRALGLPAGADVAHAMGLEALGEDHLGLEIVRDAKSREALLCATPLWYYVLQEAATGVDITGSHLGPVGGRIVSEVLIGLLEGDPSSYPRQWPNWRPGLDGPLETFTMLDLIRFTERGEAQRA